MTPTGAQTEPAAAPVPAAPRGSHPGAGAPAPALPAAAPDRPAGALRTVERPPPPAPTPARPDADPAGGVGPHGAEPGSADAGSARAVSRLAGAVRRHPDRLWVAALTALLTLTHLPLIWGGWQVNDDEGTYTAQAWALATRGTLSPYVYWYDHPPLGWLFLAGPLWLDHVLGMPVAALTVTRAATFTTQLVAVPLVYALARRLGLRRATAAVGVTLFIASPLSLFWQRMVMLDTLAVPLLAGAWVLALSPRRRLSAASACGLLLGLAVLVKETLALAVPFVVWTLLQTYRRSPNRRFATVLCLAAFVGSGFAYPLFAVLRGELVPGAGHVSLLGAAAWQVAGRTAGGSVLTAHSATQDIVLGWLHTDSWLLLAAAVAVPLALRRRRLWPVVAYGALLAALPLHDGYLPAAQVTALLLPAALTAAAGLDRLCRAVAVHRPFAAAAPGRWQRVQFGARAAAAIAAGVGVAAALVSWAPRDAAAERRAGDAPYAAAVAYVRAHVPATDPVLVDDNVWVDLVSRGRPMASTVWYTKLDLDPAVAMTFPAGWRTMRWVVRTALFDGTLGASPQVRAALAHGVPVARFGSGVQAVTVLRVVP